MTHDSYITMLSHLQRATDDRRARRGYPAPSRPRRRRRRRDVT